jgi:hypothetical protein
VVRGGLVWLEPWSGERLGRVGRLSHCGGSALLRISGGLGVRVSCECRRKGGRKDAGVEYLLAFVGGRRYKMNIRKV